jgi:raffinose synthase
MPLILSQLDQVLRREIHSNGHAPRPAWLDLDGSFHWGPGGFVQANAPLRKPTEKLGLVRPQGVKRWTAIGTYNDPYWNRVRHGTAWQEVPAKTQFLVWEQNDGGYGILLPLLSGDYVTTLQGEKNGVRLLATTGRKKQDKIDPVVAYAAVGHDLYQLVDKSVRAVAAYTKSFRLREEKKVPAFVDYLGWCSWDAFYSKVDERKFLSALKSFRDGGIRPGFVILDDGWLENKGDLLRGFSMNGEKFPRGLGPLVRQAKDEFGVTFFGIWHAFNGYWGGVDPQSPLGKKYDVLKSMGSIRPWAGDKRDPLYLVNPQQASRFYTEFHNTLKAGGVDLIKVDGQSALTEFTRPHYGRVSAMRSYQQALQSSAVRHFDGGMIHCMSNGLDVAYQLEQTLVWRNSDDFFPKKTSSAQQEHVHTNALNNLWTGTFALPDWDMFQSHHRSAEFHAAARALSGGPIYVCDKPGKQNFRILRQLASSDGRVWRCDRPALPSPDSVFTDCRTKPVLLKIHNRSGAIGLIGLFHCSEVKKQLKGSYSPADIPDLKGSYFITRRHTNGEVNEMHMDEWAQVTLPRMGFEIITISPALDGWIAPLGRLERYIGATSLASATLTSGGNCRVTTRESGSYLFWCEKPVKVTDEKGRAVLSKYNRKTKLLTVAMKEAGTLLIGPLES